MTSDKELMWLLEHPEEELRYKGEYIAIVDDKVIAHGKEFQQVIEDAKRHSPDPLLVKVSEWDVVVLWSNFHINQ